MSEKPNPPCAHHWHKCGATISTLGMGLNEHRAPVQCCHCGVVMTKAWKDVWVTPDGCGRFGRRAEPSPDFEIVP